MHADIIQFCVACRCNTLKKFANWVEHKGEIQSTFLDGVPACRASREQLAILRQCWAEAVQLVKNEDESGRKRQLEEVSEDPLPVHDQRSLEKVFSQTYNWALEPTLRGSDALLGRVHREFRNWTPTMLDVGRVRSMAHFTKTATQKRHRSGEIEIALRGQMEIPDVKDPHKLRNVLMKYTVLGNTWGMGGCFRVSENSPTLYCHWQEATKYVRHLHTMTLPLLDQYTEDSVVSYLTTVEELWRGEMLEYARCGPSAKRWGECLLFVLDKRTHLWDSHRHLLVPRGGGKNKGAASSTGALPYTGQYTVQPPKPVGVKGKGKNSKNKGGSFARSSSTNKYICKGFNEGRCRAPCPQKEMHVCNAILTSGWACEGHHQRNKHDPAKHGAVR